MDLTKLSSSAKMDVNNGFLTSLRNDGKIGALIKTTSNISSELNNLGVFIQGGEFKMGGINSISFFPEILSDLTEIKGIVYIDFGGQQEIPIPQLNTSFSNPIKRSIFSLKNIIISIIATGSLFYFLRKRKII